MIYDGIPISEWLSKARERAGLTKAELARLSGVSKSAISNYENGRRTNMSADVMISLAKVLAGKDADLVGGMDQLVLENYLAGNDVSEFISRIRRLRGEDQSLRSQLNNAFDKLNDLGQNEAVKRVSELTEIPRYTEGGEDHGQ